MDAIDQKDTLFLALPLHLECPLWSDDAHLKRQTLVPVIPLLKLRDCLTKNVVEGPLYIVYIVSPQLDCLVCPGSCRGSMKVPATRPYLKITVRDDQTHEIVAEDGYAREFSSDTGKYEITVETKEGSTTSTPGPRYIPIYKEGMYHLTIEGNYLDVDLSIITGTSPDPLDVSIGSRSGQPVAPVATLPPEEEGWG